MGTAADHLGGGPSADRRARAVPHHAGDVDQRLRGDRLARPVPGADQKTFTEIPAMAMRVQFEHPGMYPRNPFGMGYLVHDGEVPKMFAPCLEDPADPLTDDRLITGDAKAWWRQPLPWCLDWTSPIMYPRACWFGPDVDPWFPAPDDGALAEVRRGFVGEDFGAAAAREGRWTRASSRGPATVLSSPVPGTVRCCRYPACTRSTSFWSSCCPPPSGRSSSRSRARVPSFPRACTTSSCVPANCG